MSGKLKPVLELLNVLQDAGYISYIANINSVHGFPFDDLSIDIHHVDIRGGSSSMLKFQFIHMSQYPQNNAITRVHTEFVLTPNIDTMCNVLNDALARAESGSARGNLIVKEFGR